MAKKYFYKTLLLAFFCIISVLAQEAKAQSKQQDPTNIEGLSVYPNPVTGGKVFITSKNDLTKEVMIFDVLGKKVLQAQVSSKELNVSALSPGVYIIKINEENASATRKLIVR